MRPSVIFSALVAATVVKGSNGAVVLTADPPGTESAENTYITDRAVPVSRATLFYRDDVPVIHWGEASFQPETAANEVYGDSPVGAYAIYDREGHNATGWGKLWVVTHPNVSLDSAMYAAGYLEGMPRRTASCSYSILHSD